MKNNNRYILCSSLTTKTSVGNIDYSLENKVMDKIIRKEENVMYSYSRVLGLLEPSSSSSGLSDFVKFSMLHEWVLLCQLFLMLLPVVKGALMIFSISVFSAEDIVTFAGESK